MTAPGPNISFVLKHFTLFRGKQTSWSLHLFFAPYFFNLSISATYSHLVLTESMRDNTATHQTRMSKFPFAVEVGGGVKNFCAFGLTPMLRATLPYLLTTFMHDLIKHWPSWESTLSFFKPRNFGFGSCVWATHTYYKRTNLALTCGKDVGF